MHPEQGCKQQDAAVAILDVSGMDDGVEQQTQRIYQNVALLALDLFARIIAMRIDASPPFFGAFHTLAVDDGSRRARFAFRLLAARDIERMVDTFEIHVAIPQYKLVMSLS